MITSGLRSAIHLLEKSNPLKTGAQYGCPVLPRSIAAPIAGTCETLTLATILATTLPLRLTAGRFACRLATCGFASRFAPVAFDRTTAVEHHLCVLFLCGTGHERSHVLKGKPVGREQLGQKIDVAAQIDHLVPVALQDGFALLLRHWEFLQIGRLVRFELRAVLGLHQRHAEHVEVIALARTLHVEERRAGDVIELILRSGRWSLG